MQCSLLFSDPAPPHLKIASYISEIYTVCLVSSRINAPVMFGPRLLSPGLVLIWITRCLIVRWFVTALTAWGQHWERQGSMADHSVANPPESFGSVPNMYLSKSHPPPELFQESHKNHLKW